MISSRGLAALRVAATLCHSLPHVRARIRAGDTTLLHVLNLDPGDAPPLEARVLSPCEFRCAVLQAHHRHQGGERLAFMHLPAGTEPAIDIAIPAAGIARPGGIYKVPLDGRWLWAFATTIDPDTAYDLGAELISSANLTAVRALGIRPDPALGVSLAYAETTATIGPTGETEIVDLLESLLARWATHELLTEIAPESSTGSAAGDVHDPRTL